MQSDENALAESDCKAFRAEIADLKDRVSRQRDELKKEIESNKGWRDVQLETWHLLAFGSLMIALIAAGLLGGMYLMWTGTIAAPHPAVEQGARPGVELQFQQILSAFIPGVMLVLTVFIGFVGLKRLQAYDTEIREARKEQREQMTAATNYQQEQLRQMFVLQHAFEESVAGIIKVQAAAAVRSELEAVLDQHKQAISDTEKRIMERKEQIDDTLSEYAWLQKASEAQRKALHEGSVSSAGQAHKLITVLMENDDTATAVAVAERTIKDESIGGTPEDWFNISAQLGSNDQERHALSACQRGLHEHPRNVDLLSHALQFTTKLGRREEANKYYGSLLEVGMDTWNWRCFVFVSDYLIASGKSDRAIEVSEEFSKRIPTDERGYSHKARIYQKIGQIDKVIEICQQGWKAVERRSTIGIILAEALIESGRYDEALKACDEALIGTAELQPSTDISNLIWTRGSIFDAYAIMSLRETGQGKLDDAIEHARRAVVNYRTASGMRGLVRQYTAQTNNRVLVLVARLKEARVTKEQLAYVLGQDEPDDS